jgi:putative colanic acid biosynthesis acetyltransferase WcaF
VELYSLGEIEIGMNVVISQKCYLCTGSHDYQSDDFRIYAEKISVKDECWLATDVYVAPGITIHEGIVVGARSSVFKDLSKPGIYTGSPAKFVKER